MSYFSLHRLSPHVLKCRHLLWPHVSLVKSYSRCSEKTFALGSRSMIFRRGFMNTPNDDFKGKGGVKSPDEILNECSRLYESLSHLNEKLGGMAIPKSSPHTRWVQTKNNGFIIHELYSRKWIQTTDRSGCEEELEQTSNAFCTSHQYKKFAFLFACRQSFIGKIELYQLHFTTRHSKGWSGSHR